MHANICLGERYISVFSFSLNTSIICPSLKMSVGHSIVWVIKVTSRNQCLGIKQDCVSWVKIC